MIAGERIVLTPLTGEDAPAMFRWLNDPELAHRHGPFRPVDSMAFGPWYAALGKDPSKVFFAIRPLAGDRLLGYVAVSDIHPVFRSAELGILIGDAADRGHGHGREALLLAMGFCWNDLNLERLTLKVYGRNDAAIRCYLGVGFVHEGTMRRAAFVDGNPVDITVMGALNPRIDPGS